MNEIKSFTLYNEIFRLIDTIQPTSKRDEFLGILIDFYFKDKKPNFKPNSYEETIWINISKPIIAYKSKVVNGSKGGRPKKTENKSKNKSESKTTSDVNVNVNVNVKNNKFKKPTPEEIHQYCIERNNFVNWQQFYDFYESKDWMVGKNKMKDWKACVRTWEQRTKKQENLPDWWDKEIKKEEFDDKEIKELIGKYE